MCRPPAGLDCGGFAYRRAAPQPTQCSSTGSGWWSTQSHDPTHRSHSGPQPPLQTHPRWAHFAPKTYPHRAHPVSNNPPLKPPTPHNHVNTDFDEAEGWWSTPPPPPAHSTPNPPRQAHSTPAPPYSLTPTSPSPFKRPKACGSLCPPPPPNPLLFPPGPLHPCPPFIPPPFPPRHQSS